MYLSAWIHFSPAFGLGLSAFDSYFRDAFFGTHPSWQKKIDFSELKKNLESVLKVITI